MKRILSFLISISFFLTIQARSKKNSSVELDSEKDIEFCWCYYDFTFWGHPMPDYITVQLDEIVDFINSYPDAKFVISGHTGGRGNEAYHSKLSQKRAEYVTQLLVSRGLDRSKVISVGYGSSRPIIENAQTEEECQHNGRVEIRFLK